MALKKANTAYITDPKKTQYNGFAEDVMNLTDAVKEMDLENRIETVLVQLREKKSTLAAQENNNAKDFQVSALEQLIEQLKAIKQFAGKVRINTTGDETSLNILMNWKATDPTDQRYRETEQEYEGCTNDLMELVNDSMALFCGGNANGFPTNIRQHLDSFNLTDGYKAFATENSVFEAVDQIFTDVSKLYTKTTKIVTKCKRHKKEKELEVTLDYEKKNLEAFGKKCVEDPNYSLKNFRDTLQTAETEYTEAKQAEQTAQKAFADAEKKYQQARLAQTRLIGQEAGKSEKLQKAETDYTEKLSALVAAKDTREEVAEALRKEKEDAEKAKAKEINDILTIKNDLDKFTFPDLKELNEAKNAKHKSYWDYLNPDSEHITKLVEGESEAKKEVEAVNHKIKKAQKNSKDDRLNQLVEAEGERSRYMQYPVFGRALRAQFAKLPKKYRINCDTFNVYRINGEIDRLIETKQCDIGVWDPIKGMLDHIKKFCPNEYITQPLSEAILSDCEEKARLLYEKLDNDELHSSIEQYKKLKDEIARLTAEKNDAKKDKKLYKEKDTALKAKEKELAALTNGSTFFEDALNVREWIDHSIAYSSVVFDFNDKQADFYVNALKQTAKDEDTQNQNIYQAHKDLYNKLQKIYDSLPADVLIKSGKGSTLRLALQDMEHSLESELEEAFRLDPQVFESAYNEFKENFQAIKDQVDQKLEETRAKDVTSAIDEAYADRIKATLANVKKAAKAVATAEKKRNDVRAEKDLFDEQLQKATEEKATAESTFNNARSDYEAKQQTTAQKKDLRDRAKEQLNETDAYYQNKETADHFDVNNDELKSSKYKIDKTGDSFYVMIRHPFDQYYERKDYAKKKKHGNSREYNNMINHLAAIVSLPTDTSIANYKSAIETLKTFAQAYVTAREKQFFQNNRNPMRRYRLSYAKGLISLCDDQLQNLDGSERTVEINPAVDTYLKRTKKVEVKHMTAKETEDAKIAYNDSLDARKNEAIAAYKNSVEYKGKKASEAKRRKSIRQMREEEDQLIQNHEQQDAIRMLNISQNRIIQPNLELANNEGMNISFSEDNKSQKREIKKGYN